jgi:hypothetical protein
MFQFFVLRVIIEGKNRHSIINVKSEAETTIVYHKDLSQISILNNSEVFDISKGCHDTIISIEPLLKDRAIRVKKV